MNMRTKVKILQHSRLDANSFVSNILKANANKTASIILRVK